VTLLTFAIRSEKSALATILVTMFSSAIYMCYPFSYPNPAPIPKPALDANCPCSETISSPLAFIPSARL
jgi:hypothetical protein